MSEVEITVDTPIEDVIKSRGRLVTLARKVFREDNAAVRALTQFTKAAHLSALIEAKRDGIFDYNVLIQDIDGGGLEWPRATVVLEALDAVQHGNEIPDDLVGLLGISEEELPILLMQRKTPRRSAAKKRSEPREEPQQQAEIIELQDTVSGIDGLPEVEEPPVSKLAQFESLEEFVNHQGEEPLTTSFLAAAPEDGTFEEAFGGNASAAAIDAHVMQLQEDLENMAEILATQGGRTQLAIRGLCGLLETLTIQVQQLADRQNEMLGRIVHLIDPSATVPGLPADLRGIATETLQDLDLGLSHIYLPNVDFNAVVGDGSVEVESGENEVEDNEPAVSFTESDLRALDLDDLKELAVSLGCDEKVRNYRRPGYVITQIRKLGIEVTK